ncbi:MAG: hypothetical protein ACI9U2_003783 [Bradymonadia bacterium]|jgi:hypothetical protein
MRSLFCLVLMLIPILPTPAHAHGPSTTDGPTHDFQWAPHRAEHGQIGVNFGLTQLLLGGFNVAVEGRWDRWVLEYSHGIGLDYNRLGEGPLTDDEKRLSLDVDSPWTTGAGIGFVLLDELYIGAEFKGHRYVVERPGGERAEYTTASIGPVIGWRYFIWRGLHANVYLRYWPNVWSSLDDDTHTFSDGEEHAAKDLQFFANISIGWAFDLGE